MIVVDSSVWIDFFNGTESDAADRLDQALGVEQVAVADIILVEVLQGVRRDTDYRTARRVLTALPVLDMLGASAAVRSAEAYRSLRRRDVTIRKTVDVAIASYCIGADLALLSSDRDFQPFVDHLGLQAA